MAVKIVTDSSAGRSMRFQGAGSLKLRIRFGLLSIALFLTIFLFSCGCSSPEESDAIVTPELPETPPADEPPEVPENTDGPLLSENTTTTDEEPAPVPSDNTSTPDNEPDILPEPEPDDEEDPRQPSDNTTQEMAEKWVDDLPSGELVFTPYGMMVKYFGERIPISICLPAAVGDDFSVLWYNSEPSENLPTYPLLKRYSDKWPSQLSITEVSFEEVGLPEMTLDDYARDVIDVNSSFIPDFNLETAVHTSLSDTIEVAIIVFSSEKGQLMHHRLIYIHENGYIFNMTYLHRPQADDISEMIDYSFSSLTLK